MVSVLSGCYSIMSDVHHIRALSLVSFKCDVAHTVSVSTIRRQEVRSTLRPYEVNDAREAGNGNVPRDSISCFSLPFEVAISP